ncbi:hypothetical protein AB0C27_02160 [Nonomuraea sp. NPDC048882]|uniref:hypothetical protein n=1 Tax=Nonomuraea sp. NPDC048882 TaxID=3154347 RepID=UPI0033FC02F7
MSDFWEESLRDESRAPHPDGTQSLNGADSEDADGVASLLQATEPEQVAQAGRNYLEIARMCGESVAELSAQARAISETLGGESLEGIFKTLGELQRDLARINAAATSVGTPLEWYGDKVLRWFKDNVPGTGSVGLDDDLFDAFGSVEDNGHVLARHHLRLLNGYMGDVYGAIAPTVEQRTSAPGTDVTGMSPGRGLGLPGGLTGDPYAGGGLTSPYGKTPGFGSPYDPDVPGLQQPPDPSLTDPSLRDPSLQDPSLRDPSLQDPSLSGGQNPGVQPPGVQHPSLRNPDIPGMNPPLLDPPTGLTQPPSTTNLSSLPPSNLPPTGPGTTTLTPTGNGSGITTGTSPVTPFGGNVPRLGAAGAGLGPNGMPLGMMPPFGAAGTGAGQERERERTRMALVEDEAFESEDLGGPPVVA